MDTLTHALSGALVGRVLAGRRAPSAIAAGGAPRAARVQPPVWQMVVAGTVAATFPDLDFVLGWFYIYIPFFQMVPAKLRILPDLPMKLVSIL